MPYLALTLQAAVLLLLVASVVGAWIGHLRIPYTVGLVVVGIVLDVVGLLPPTALDPELVLVVLLPPLLFEAAFVIEWHHLRAVAGPVVALATLGVLVSATVSAAVVVAALGLAVPVAATFGALMGATDPVAVVTFFRRARVDPKLRTLVDAESLLNDGTAVVLVTILVSVFTAQQVTPGSVVRDFLWLSGGGLATGVAVGLLGCLVTRGIDDPILEATVSIVVAYGSYLIAQTLGISGILATVAAGSMLGNLGRRVAMSPASAEWVATLWEFFAFVANSLVFLLLGVAVRPSALAGDLPAIAVGVVAALAGRAVAVYGLGLPLHRVAGCPSLRWRHVLFVGGLRGALPVVVAFSLGERFPAVASLTDLVLGVVVGSLIVQGLALEPTLRRVLAGPRVPSSGEST